MKTAENTDNKLVVFVEMVWQVVIVRSITKWQKRRCKRARRYLLTHDHSYRDSHAGVEIVRRRQKLYENGVSPLDPCIPDRWSMEEELPRMAWPNKSNFP